MVAMRALNEANPGNSRVGKRSDQMRYRASRQSPDPMSPRVIHAAQAALPSLPCFLPVALVFLFV